MQQLPFRIQGLSFAAFAHLVSMDDAALATKGIQRVIADDATFPCRVTLEHAHIGESLLLLNHEHQAATNSPYRASGPIFVREAHTQTFDEINVIPDPLRIRLISLRAYDAADMMVDAEVIDGNALATQIDSFLRNPEVVYLHAHYARRGCYAARVTRA